MAIGRIPEPGTGIPESIVDAKGDIVTATAGDTPARLAVGSNETRLVADSAQATGLKYVADTTNYAIAAKGDLLVGTAADTLQALSVGTNGHTLVADSAEATGLKWAAPAGGSTFAGVRLYNSSNASLSNATTTIINFNSENFDTDGFHSTSSNTSRITIPSGKGGYYSIGAIFSYEQNNTGIRQIRLIKNGTFKEYVMYSTASGGPIIGYSSVWDLTVGDYIEVEAYQNSGSTLQLYGNEFYFWAYYLGA